METINKNEENIEVLNIAFCVGSESWEESETDFCFENFESALNYAMSAKSAKSTYIIERVNYIDECGIEKETNIYLGRIPNESYPKTENYVIGTELPDGTLKILDCFRYKFNPSLFSYSQYERKCKKNNNDGIIKGFDTVGLYYVSRTRKEDKIEYTYILIEQCKGKAKGLIKKRALYNHNTR